MPGIDKAALRARYLVERLEGEGYRDWKKRNKIPHRIWTEAERQEVAERSHRIWSDPAHLKKMQQVAQYAQGWKTTKGPVTEEGLHRSRTCSIKHGLNCNQKRRERTAKDHRFGLHTLKTFRRYLSVYLSGMTEPEAVRCDEHWKVLSVAEQGGRLRSSKAWDDLNEETNRIYNRQRHAKRMAMEQKIRDYQQML